MLDKIRGKSGSIGTTIIFSLIIIAFVFIGAGSFTLSTANIAVKVNGEDISMQMYARKVQNVYNAGMQENPGLANNSQLKDDIKSTVLDNIILRTLLLQKVAEYNISVSPQELFTVVSSISAFRDAAGNFDPVLYKTILEGQGRTPALFEAEIRESVAIEKLKRLVIEGIFLTEEEVKMQFDYGLQPYSAQYLYFPKADYADQVEISEEMLRKYYTQNQADFVEAEKVSVDYILVNAPIVAEKISISDEVAKKYYDENPAEFTRPAEYKVQQIYLATPTNEETKKQAEEIVAQITKDLKSKKKKFSDIKGPDYSTPALLVESGDIGWISLGQGVAELEEAIKKLKPGEWSEIIITPFGWHILFVEEVRPEKVYSFKEVRDDIVKAMKDAEADALVTELRKASVEALNDGKSLSEIAQICNVEVDKTALLNKQALRDTLSMHNSNLDILDNVPVGEIVPVPFDALGGFAILQLTASVKAYTPEFDELKDRLTFYVRQQQEKILATQAAQNALDQLKSGNASQELLAKLKVSTPFSHAQPLITVDGGAVLVENLLELPLGAWSNQVLEIGGGALITNLYKALPIDESIWLAEKSNFTTNLFMYSQEIGYQNYLDKILSEADIHVYEENISSINF